MSSKYGPFHIIYAPDDPLYANDLSFMTDADWELYDQRRREREARQARYEHEDNLKNACNESLNSV